MDSRIRGYSYSGSLGVIQERNDQNSASGSRFEYSSLDRRFREFRGPQSSDSIKMVKEDSAPEDCDFSDAVLRYINQILMEEDMDEKTCMLQDSLDLQAAEKSFYDVLGKKYPPSPERSSVDVNGLRESLDHDLSRSSNDRLIGNLGGCQNSWGLPVCSVSRSSFSSRSSVVTSVDVASDSLKSLGQVPDWNGEIQSVCQFRKEVEEANKFLSRGNMESSEAKARCNDMVAEEERRNEDKFSDRGLKGRKNFYTENSVAEEGRSHKQAAVYPDPSLRSELFDMVLLCSSLQDQTTFSDLREAFQNGTAKIMPQDPHSEVSNVGKRRGNGKKKNGKKVVDLRTLLTRCAQFVATDDHRNAYELLKQIRQHASLYGDGNQRMAHYFADGLEARLVGTGSEIYKGTESKRSPAAEVLKAYLLHTAACPFRKVSNFIANKTIVMVADKSKQLHIIDFGILYGFQWPTLIQRLSMREGGPPKLKITGIELPQPGFRPAERLEETGLRLAAYAEMFNVPFEYNAIAKRWDAIKIEELEIDKNEVVVVNCLYRAKNLLDESVTTTSPKNVVLNLIKQINPDIFIHGVVNGAYSVPLYVTRFREAMFHYSAMFDMLETIVPRDNQERMLIEKGLLGREVLNVLACEGTERVERPETYKQWQGRNVRAGFVQVSFQRNVVKEATDRVRSYYHKDFMIDEHNRWLLQGWKGRMIYAISAWKPAYRARD